MVVSGASERVRRERLARALALGADAAVEPSPDGELADRLLDACDGEAPTYAFGGGGAA